MLNITDPNQEKHLTACGGELLDPTGYPAAEYEGRTYYFCTRACLRVYKTDPHRFMSGEIDHPLEEDE